MPCSGSSSRGRCVHVVSGLRVITSSKVGESSAERGFPCWGSPSVTSVCRLCVLSVRLCSCWDSSSASVGVVSLSVCGDAMLSLLPGVLLSSGGVALSVHVVERISERASPASAV